MIEKIFEDTYSKYSPTYKLQALSEYYSKLPTSSTTKYVKFLRFSKDVASIYNVSRILVTPNIADDDGKIKKVHIEYTGDEASKVMTVKTFATQCRKIFTALKNEDPENVEVLAVLAGTDKAKKFRFYFDSENNFAILVNGTDTKGLEAFLENYEGDLAAAVSVAQSTKAPKTAKLRVPREKKPNKPNPHEGYELIDNSKENGHTVRIWKKDPNYDPNMKYGKKNAKAAKPAGDS